MTRKCENRILSEEKLAYSIQEVASLTGLSTSYLYHLSARGEFPVCKIGARCIILAEDLKEWLKQRRRGWNTKRNVTVKTD